VDAFVPRVQPEPVVTGSRGFARPQQRRKRARDGEGPDEAHFPLETQHEEAHAGHAQPRSPNEDGLGRNLDVTA